MPDLAPPAADSGLAAGMLFWQVEGMGCASCVAKVRTAVSRLPGISGVEVNPMAERLTPRRDPDGTMATGRASARP